LKAIEILEKNFADIDFNSTFVIKLMLLVLRGDEQGLE
jgi:hypothetical protein